MRVKLLLALAIASVLLLCSVYVATAAVSGVPTAAQLTNSANQQCNACGFPDLGAIDAGDAAMGIPADTLDATVLGSPICGVCGEIPASTCNEVTNDIVGPEVNLGCPMVATVPVPVELNVPAVEAEFSPIDIRPQAIIGLPQINLCGVCNNIVCLPVTNFNECPDVDDIE
jgi:hypothetical protein